LRPQIQALGSQIVGRWGFPPLPLLLSLLSFFVLSSLIDLSIMLHALCIINVWNETWTTLIVMPR
jgi:hypothetical protein